MALIEPPDFQSGMEDETASPLAPLGISSDSERAYRAALRHAGESIDDVCSATGRSRTELLADFEPLIRRQLLNVIDNVVVPEAPEFALRRVLTRESRRLADLTEALETVENQLPQYASEHHDPGRADWRSMPLDVVPAGQVVDAMTSLVASTSGELLFMRPDQWYMPVGLTMDEVVTAAVSNGRPSRALYPFKLLEQGHDSADRRIVAGEQVRLLTTVPTRLAVFGDEAVALPDQWGSPLGAIMVIRQAPVVAACRSLFDELWSKATILPGPGGDVSQQPDRQRLLEMLSRGAKDEQISRTLGLSLRTVRRRIAELLAELGVDTRFQAGLEAARRGWL
jgi:DNA-binding CsgD family transcriptional regulator